MLKYAWVDMSKLLIDYYNENGNIDIPVEYVVKGIPLGRWLYHRKNAYKGIGHVKITNAQIKLLESLGVKWNSNSDTWDEYYNLLKEYKETHKNVDVPRSYEVNGKMLGNWLNTQRCSYKGHGSSVINKKQIKLLESLGVKWNLEEEKWDEYYNLLKDYKEQYNNTDVKQKYEVNNLKLGIWVNNQRSSYKGYIRLTRKQINLLNKLEFDWGPRDTKILNKEITSANSENYNQVLVSRVNHILDDLINEEINQINTAYDQEKVNQVLIKRVWR